MRGLLLAASLLLLTPQIARADLGEAESSTTGQTAFDVWCSKRKNNCNVEISDTQIIVNGKGGVNRSQVLKIWRDKEMRNFWDRNPMNYYQDAFYVTYRKEDGSETTGKFIVLHERTGSEFWNRLIAFMGSEARPMGPSIKVELEPTGGTPAKTQPLQSKSSTSTSCNQPLNDFDCSWSKYLDANPSVKAWAEANPAMADKEKIRLGASE